MRSAVCAQIYHYEWDPVTIWKRFAEHSNSDRWNAVLADIKKGKYPFLSSNADFEIARDGTVTIGMQEVARHLESWAWTRHNLGARPLSHLSNLIPCRGTANCEPEGHEYNRREEG